MAATFSGIKVTGVIRLNTGSVPTPTDQYSQYTVLRLPGTGTNNTANNTFIDSSSNNFTVTRFRNTRQGSFSPFSTAAGYWSNYFDGNGDFLNFTGGSSVTLNGDFTVEAWVFYNGSISNDPALLSIGRYNIGGGIFYTNSSGQLALYANQSIKFTSNRNVTINAWNHVAFVRSGSTLTCYINGISSGNTSYSETIQESGGIGSYISNGYASTGLAGHFLNGYISNLRVVKGTALYTSDFTPSTTPLTAVTNTSLLTCQSNRFIDNSTNNFTVTRNGDTSISSFGPFAPASSYNAATMGGSMYFDGDGDYLRCDDALDSFTTYTDQYTIEGWAYPLSTSSGFIVGINTSTNGTNILLIGNTALNTNNNIDYSHIMTPRQWNHFAYVNTGTSGQYYLNGILVGTYNTTNTAPLSACVLGIGAEFDSGNGGSPGNYLNSYVSNLRITSGRVYTANFTPPTSPVAAITGTSLLLNGTNGAIVDQSTKNNIETLGDAKISTAISANGSMYFDGSGDYLSAPASNLFNFGTGNFTIECWIYPAAIPVSPGSAIIDTRSASTVGWAFQLRSNFQLRFFQENTIFIDSNELLTQNVWNHVALVRSASTLRVYVNGISTNSSASTTSFTSPQFNIGAKSWSGSTLNAFNGYINDLRITNGIARYTANFTPPTRS